MKDALAERLLAAVMQWTSAEIANERPVLQALAMLKYDEYQQFSPGMRFVESLALWLGQFESLAERRDAYEFVLNRMVFLSQAEMAHFAAVAYPDIIRPVLISHAAKDAQLAPFYVSKILGTEEFRRLQDTSFFLGLSDGARIDLFRRSNKELSHEQIFTSYELSTEKLSEIRKRLTDRGHSGSASTLVLLDDFSASGTSCLSDDQGKAKGKVKRFVERICSSKEWGDVVSFPATKLLVVLYVATEFALDAIQKGAQVLHHEHGVDLTVHCVQKLVDGIRITSAAADKMTSIIETYYDPSAKDMHPEWGGDVPYGYKECGLPLVLHHNTPNNSLFLLWAEDSAKVRPLFPRISRHRREA